MSMNQASSSSRTISSKLSLSKMITLESSSEPGVSGAFSLPGSLPLSFFFFFLAAPSFGFSPILE